MTSTATPTRDDLERLEALRDELAGDLEQARDESRKLAEAARKATREGQDPDDIIDRQVRAASRVATYRDTLSDLVAEIEEVRTVVLQAEAEERLTKGLLRAAGSIEHELREDEEKVQRLSEELERARTNKRNHATRLEQLAFEARLLALRFALPAPPVVQGTNPPAMLEGAFRIEVLDEERVRVVAPGRGKKTVGGESGRLLAAGGPWERTQAEVAKEMAARREAKDSAMRAACARVDDWLRDVLKGGPAAKDRVMQKAEEAGLPIHPSPNHCGASLLDARQRLGVLPLETRESKVAFWCLPDVPFDQDTLRIYQGESRRSREMTAAMR